LIYRCMSRLQREFRCPAVNMRLVHFRTYVKLRGS
jgi:hypothetical protein